MSLAVLNQVYTEARRLAIAGSNLAVGDFRLKKLVEPLEKSAQKAPVFGAVAKAIDKLVGGTDKDSAQSLLDLSSLVLAILYTQGQSSVEGKTQPIASKELSLVTTQLPARVLKPLIEALTSTGGGRMEVIREGYERGAFDDIRLVNPAVKALDDSYSEIADFVTDNILPKFGSSILPEIRDKIDIKGRAGNVRRLRLLHALDPAGARPIVLEAFENGSKEIRIAALGCLGDSAEDLPHLLEQAEAKSKEVRQVALGRLGKFKDDVCINLLIKAIAGTDRPLVVASVRESQSEPLWKSVLSTTQRELDELFTQKDKTKLDKAVQRFNELLLCYHERRDKAALAQLAAIHERRVELRKLKATPSSGADVVEQLCEIMLISGDKKLLELLVADREQMQDERFACSAAAGLLTLSPKQFFDDYSKYYSAKPAKSSKSRYARDESTRSSIVSLMPNGEGHWYGRRWSFFCRLCVTPEKLDQELKQKTWDPRWLDAAIAADDVDAAISLGQPKHAALQAFLTSRFASAMKKKEIEYELYWMLKAIVTFGYPDATQNLIQLL
ncbi:MAG: HEAT repeat domain-containing protein, partial [Pirellulaceae bacterium]|nr:HEAT repeat domain-containing protein [Pirellulaceae bacterium]